nr:hypothetical protein [Pandoravirus massiliensis]
MNDSDDRDLAATEADAPPEAPAPIPFSESQPFLAASCLSISLSAGSPVEDAPVPPHDFGTSSNGKASNSAECHQGSAVPDGASARRLTKKEKKYLRAESNRLAAFIMTKECNTGSYSGKAPDAPIEIQWAMNRIQKIDQMLYPQSVPVKGGTAVESGALVSVCAVSHALALGLVAGVVMSYFGAWCRGK